MQIPLEIDFRNMERSPALEARAQKLALLLERYAPHIIRCHVTIEAPHHHQHQGRLYRVIVHATLPGGDVAVRHSRPADHSHEDPYVALRDAFRAIRRRLQDYERQRRGDVKTHVKPPRGRMDEPDRKQAAQERR